MQKELVSQYYGVRLWRHNELMEKLFAHYTEHPEEIRLAMPLKPVWMVA